MSVIGFDIGNDSCVIAAAKRGGVDVLLNDESKRETPAVVSFVEKQRFLGSAGAAFATKNPESTISQIKRLIGKLYKEVEEDLKLLPFATSEGPRGGILIELEYLKRKWTFTPVEILGMLLKHLKQITEKNLESLVVDCVIGIPSYFSDLQRRMYLDAALIAGLKPLRLMHDGTAIALGYGMYKTDFSDSGPTNVMFVDIGHCDTQVTLAAFEPGKMKILSHSFDQNLGGRDFDEVLFNHFAAQFNEKYKIDVKANARASIRLRASCEKVKKVLSANAEAPISIECLIGDTDVRGFITREEFEKLSSKLLERVTIPCGMALKDAGLSVDKICTIELVGSGSRIPVITRILTKFFKKEPTRTLNASECVARGCALRCAMLSPTLLVRDYKIEDSFPYSIVIPSPQGEFMLFRKGSPFPNEKIMKRKGNTDFVLEVAYINERDFPAGRSHIIGCFMIGASEPSDAENGVVEFRVKLNGYGIVEMDSAKILEDRSHFGRALYSRIGLDNSPMLNLPVSENLDFATTNDELSEAKDKEKMLVEQDIKVEETKDRRNTLESFVYDTRSKLAGAYRSYATDSEKEVITNNLQETEDWLYEDSDDEVEQDYSGRLKDLKELLEPIELRYNEASALAKSTKALRSCIDEYHLRADSLSAEKKAKIKDVCMRAGQWLSNLSQDPSSPKTLSTKINRKIDIVERNCKSIISSETNSFLRREKPMDSGKAREKEATPLQTCIENYKLHAESLPADMKEKVQDVCRGAEMWLRNFVSGKHSSSKTLPTNVNSAIELLQLKCESIISSKSSSQRHEEPMDSDRRYQSVEPDLAMDSENARTIAKNALLACIAQYRSDAESLSADLKNKVIGECMRAEQWLSSVSQNPSSPNGVASYINYVIESFQSKCESLISSEDSFSRHEEPVVAGQMDQTVESNQKDQPLDSDNARTIATKDLQDCIAKYCWHAESLPVDMKEKVNEICMRAEQWLSNVSPNHLSLNSLTTYINHVESNCESIIGSKASFSRHEEPGDLKQGDQQQPMEIEQTGQPMESGERDPRYDIQSIN